MKRQILFLIDSLTCGGAEKSLISLLPLLDYSKLEVDLMMGNRGGVFERYVPSEVNIIPFPTQRGFLFKLSQRLFSVALRMFPNRHGAELRWRAMGRAYKGLVKEYDVAIAYQQGFPTYYIAEKVKAKMKAAWVNADITKVGYNADFNRPFYDMYNKVIPVSDKLCTILKNSDFVDSFKLYTIFDILNVTLIRQMSSEQEVKLPNKNKLTLCTVGRMVALKGYDLAVETARVLKSKGIDFCWYFVGDGGERMHILNLISQYDLQENVKLMGLQPNPYPYMAAADIYVQTSRFEGFGLTIAEAKILGKPVVSTNFDVVHDQLQHEENGMIAEMTPESLAENIIRLINDKDLRERIIANVKKEENTTYITEVEKVHKMIFNE